MAGFDIPARSHNGMKKQRLATGSEHSGWASYRPAATEMMLARRASFEVALFASGVRKTTVLPQNSWPGVIQTSDLLCVRNPMDNSQLLPDSLK
jgi:hypothetical protein